jgi:hypothetical protein
MPISLRRFFKAAFKAGFVLSLSATAILVYQAYGVSLLRTQYLSGWILLFLVMVLSLYNTRKKLTFLPIGAASAWLEAHILAGWFSVLLFLLHVEMRLPNGPLESALAAIFFGVAVSGLAGLWISRKFPPRLTRHGRVHLSNVPSEWGKMEGDVIYERIPIFFRRIRERAESIIVESAGESRSNTISDFYIERLDAFFSGPRNFWLHIIGSNRPLAIFLNQLSTLEQYLNPEEKLISKELGDLVRLKHHMDFHYALQGLLKRWLFVHIPLTYVLLLFIFVHVTLVYAFSAGSP